MPNRLRICATERPDRKVDGRTGRASPVLLFGLSGKCFMSYQPRPFASTKLCPLFSPSIFPLHVCLLIPSSLSLAASFQPPLPPLLVYHIVIPPPAPPSSLLLQSTLHPPRSFLFAFRSASSSFFCHFMQPAHTHPTSNFFHIHTPLHPLQRPSPRPIPSGSPFSFIILIITSHFPPFTPSICCFFPDEMQHLTTVPSNQRQITHFSPNTLIYSTGFATFAPLQTAYGAS